MWIRRRLESRVLNGIHVSTSAGSLWYRSSNTEAFNAVPPERERKGRWSGEERTGHIDVASGGEMKTRSTCGQILPNNATNQAPALRRSVMEMITSVDGRRSPCRGEAELKCDVLFLPLEFGSPCLETYALYTSLDGAQAQLYFLNQDTHWHVM